MEEAMERYGIKPCHLASIRFNREMLYSSSEIRQNMRSRFGSPEEWLKSILQESNHHPPDTKYLYLFLPISPMASVQQISTFYKSSMYHVGLARDDPEIYHKYMDLRRSSIAIGVDNQAELDFDMVLDEIGKGTDTLKFSCIFCLKCDELVDILYGEPCENFGIFAHRRARLIDHDIIPDNLLERAATYVMTGKESQVLSELTNRHRECLRLKAQKLCLETWVKDLSEYEDEDLEHVLYETSLIERVHNIMDAQGIELKYRKTESGVLEIPTTITDLVDKWSDDRSIHCLQLDWTFDYLNELKTQLQRFPSLHSDVYLEDCAQNVRDMMNRIERLIECIHESSKVSWDDCTPFSDLIRNYVVNGSFCDSFKFGGQDTDGAMELIFAIRVFRDAIKEM
jgi:hypothetical protein